VLGLPVLPYLTTTDPAEAVIWAAIARRAQKLRQDLDRDLATAIANAFVKAKLYG